VINMIIKLLLKLATSKAAEELIGLGINKLLKSKKNGIGKDLALTMIDGIAASKHNPTTEDVFDGVCKTLGK